MSNTAFGKHRLEASVGGVALLLLPVSGFAQAPDASRQRYSAVIAIGAAVQEQRIGAQLQGGPILDVNRFLVSVNAAIFFNGRLPLKTFVADGTRRDCEGSITPNTDSLPPCAYDASATPAMHVELRHKPDRMVAWQLGMGFRAGRGWDEPYAIIVRTFTRARLARLSLELRAGRTHTSIVVGQRL